MRIYWLGHSCFNILSEDGLSILTDPFDSQVGYRLPNVRADIVTVSHDHHDHNHVAPVKGNPVVVRGPGRHAVRGIDFKGIETYHDGSCGRLRGSNTVFCFQIEGTRICHLGDLGHTLIPDDVSSIGSVDLLFIPVGGIYTIDALGAHEVIGQLRPRIVVPMHYQTEDLSFELNEVDDFILNRDSEGPLDCLQLRAGRLEKEETRIVLLRYPHA